MDLETKLKATVDQQGLLEGCLTVVDDKSALLQEIQDTENELQLLIVESLQNSYQFPDRPLPPTAVMLLGLAFRDVTSGNRSRLFEPKKRQPGDRSSPVQDQIYRGIAIAYIELARAGVIPDRTFMKTIEETYAVVPGTPRLWLRNSELRQCAEVFIGDLANLETVDRSLASQIETLMKNSGERFQYRRERDRTSRA